MKRRDLEHIIRASGTIAEVDKIIIIGSQSILGKYPDVFGLLAVSMEADVYPLEKPELADLIDGCIGELSPFHEQFGYYAQGVGPETAILPRCWHERLIEIYNANTNGIYGYCISPEDLCISKLAAYREKDTLFIKECISQNLLNIKKIHDLIRNLPGHVNAEQINQRLLKICNMD
jgi:hypothetical protein